MLPQSPPDGAARRQVQLPPLPLPKAELSLSASQFPINHMNANYHIQYPQHMQLLLRNSSFVSDTRMMSFKPSDNDKVGAYTRQERREKIAKYRSKRALRVFRKQVKYDCRKKLADTRPRVKGRFVTKLGDDGCDDKFPPADNAAHPSGHAETSCESFA